MAAERIATAHEARLSSPELRLKDAAERIRRLNFVTKLGLL